MNMVNKKGEKNRNVHPGFFSALQNQPEADPYLQEKTQNLIEQEYLYVKTIFESHKNPDTGEAEPLIDANSVIKDNIKKFKIREIFPDTVELMFSVITKGGQKLNIKTENGQFYILESNIPFVFYGGEKITKLDAELYLYRLTAMTKMYLDQLKKSLKRHKK